MTPVQHEFRGDISRTGYPGDDYHVTCYDCGAEYRFQPRAHVESWVWSHTLENGINPFLCRALRVAS